MARGAGPGWAAETKLAVVSALDEGCDQVQEHPPAFQVPVGKGEAGRAEAGFAPPGLARPGNHKHTGGWE